MEHHRGATRHVFLVGRRAVKVPAARTFVAGWLANRSEARHRWILATNPVTTSIFGVVTVQRRAAGILFPVPSPTNLPHLPPWLEGSSDSPALWGRVGGRWVLVAHATSWRERRWWPERRYWEDRDRRAQNWADLEPGAHCG